MGSGVPGYFCFDDAVGRFCINKLKHYGVGTEYVRAVAGEFRTSLAIYESCITDFQNVIYRNGAADFEVKPSEMDKVDYSRFSALITAGTVFAGHPSRDATFQHSKCTGESLQLYLISIIAPIPGQVQK